MLDFKSICSLAKCNRRLKGDAESRFALATQELFSVSSHALELCKTVQSLGLLQYHPRIRIHGPLKVIKDATYAIIRNTVHIDNFYSLATESDYDDVLEAYIANTGLLEELKLCKTIFKSGTESLAHFLVKNKSIRSLSIVDSDLGKNSEVALSELLRGCPKLTSLNLHWSKFGKLKALIDAILDDNCNLQSLGIVETIIADDDSIKLTAMISKLSRLDVTACSISRNVIRAIGEAIGISKTITHIDLNRNIKVASEIEAFSMGLSANKSLQVLSLRNCNINTDKLLYLKDALVGKEALRKLDLNSNKFGDAGCRYVAEILTSCPSLQILDLAWNNIGIIGVEIIADVLPSANKLRQLRIYGCRIVSESSTASLFAAAKCHPNLSIINKSETILEV
jgi:hypothetical protein